MKKALLIVVTAIITNIVVTAQPPEYTPTDVYTPKGSLVQDTYIRLEMIIPSDLQRVHDEFMRTYPQAIILDNATTTTTYNCHGYAWFMTEGGYPVCMGRSTNPTSVYWNDGSYIETLTPGVGCKVSYVDDNHSAITTETPDVFIAKWGDLPLVMHHKDYGPYDSDVLRYFYRAAIFEGPEFICPTATYTLSNNAQATSWDVTPSSVFTITSSNANSVTITSSNTTGQTGTLTAIVGGVAITKTIKSCQASISGNANPYNFQQVTYSISNLPAGTPVTWSGTNNINIISGQGTNLVTVKICGGENATLTATLSGTFNQVLTKNINVNNGELEIKSYNTHIEATFTHPYAQCYDWEYSPNFTYGTNPGVINCTNQSILELSPNNGTGGYIQVRAKSVNCIAPWKYDDAHIWNWQPQLTGYFNPLRGELFSASLVEDVPNYASYGNVEYHWYFGNELFEVTYESSIQSYDWPCGDHMLRVIVKADNKEASTETDFWGMCRGNKSSAYSAAYPNPASNELIIDKTGEGNDNFATQNSTTAAKSYTIKVLLYSHATTKLVFSKDYSSEDKQIKINTLKLPDGVYYLNIIENGEKIKEQTVIINH